MDVSIDRSGDSSTSSISEALNNRSRNVSNWLLEVGAGISVMVMICSCLSCGAIRDVGKEGTMHRTSSDSSIAYAELEKSSNDRKMEAVVTGRDSLTVAYTFTVWPKGKFSYSPTKGFEGEALKFIVSGSQEKGSQVMIRRTIEEDSSRATVRNLTAKHRMQGLEKTAQVRKRLSWKVIAGLCTLPFLLILLAFGWRMLRRRFTSANINPSDDSA